MVKYIFYILHLYLNQGRTGGRISLSSSLARHIPGLTLMQMDPTTLMWIVYVNIFELELCHYLFRLRGIQISNFISQTSPLTTPETMDHQLIEEQDIKFEIAEIKVEECYNWVDDLVLGYFKNCYEEYEPVRWIEPKVHLKPAENVCKCNKNTVITRGMVSKHKKFCYLLYN